MKKYLIPLSIILTANIGCNNPAQQKTEIVEADPNIGFKVTDVLHEQTFNGTFNFKTKKAKVDQNSKNEISVNYKIKISDKEVLITKSDNSIIESYKINSKKNLDGVIEYDAIDQNKMRCQISHLVNDDGTYSYFEFRSSDKLKFYTTI
jgi:hypothetical protein